MNHKFLMKTGMKAKHLFTVVIACLISGTVASCNKGEAPVKPFIPVYDYPPIKEEVAKTVSIMGDSYSTYMDYIPNGYGYYYPATGKNNVNSVDKTWWYILCDNKSYKLETNNSWSGATISRTGWGGYDNSSKPFISDLRLRSLGNPDIILIFGGTNDAWIPSPSGNYKYSDWTTDDLRNLRPALAYLLSELQRRYTSKIYFILNSGLSADFNTSVKTICQHYDVPVLSLTDIAKEDNHPNIDGMRAIALQVRTFLSDHP